MDPSGNIGENVKWCKCYGKQHGGVPQKLKLELPYNPAISLLSLYPKNWKQRVLAKRYLKSQFTVALSIKAKRWKQSKCPSTDGLVNRERCKPDRVLYSLKGRRTFCPMLRHGWALRSFGRSETSHLQKDEHCIILLIWGIWNSQNS